MLSLFFIAIGLSMDSFSLSIAGGAAVKSPKIHHVIRIAFFFGFFQAIMPLIGWFIGESLNKFIGPYDHWVAFFLLSSVGLKMIYNSVKNKNKKKINLLDYKMLFLMSLATSIDALITGITLEFLKVPLLISVSVIGFVTFLLCFIGFWLGEKLSSVSEDKTEIIGGIILIGIGIKILIEHLF
ncbi:MAG: manganese efflux pump MntP family protein [Patescibacteria group bacterium]|nr:manganese efflux pump MntP family protein [Patescibacteria group bacterium]